MICGKKSHFRYKIRVKKKNQRDRNFNNSLIGFELSFFFFLRKLIQITHFLTDLQIF